MSLEPIIYQSLPGTLSEVSRKINRPTSNTTKALGRLLKMGKISRDDAKVYHWIGPKPIGTPNVEHKQSEWASSVYTLIEQTDDKYLLDMTHEECISFLNSNREVFEKMISVLYTLSKLQD